MIRDTIRRRPLLWLALAFVLGALVGGGTWEVVEEPEPAVWGQTIQGESP